MGLFGFIGDVLELGAEVGVGVVKTTAKVGWEVGKVGIKAAGALTEAALEAEHSNRSSSDLLNSKSAADKVAFKKRFDKGDLEARRIVSNYKNNH